MFIYDPLFYAYENRDKVHLKIFYFPLEESQENITLRFMSHLLAKKTNDKIRISPLNLRSANEKMPVSQEVLDLLNSPEYQDILKFFEETVLFFEDKNPTGIYRQLKSYAENNGIIHKKTIKIANRKTGDIEEVQAFDYYEPKDPNEYVIIFIDHISLISNESNMDLRQSINKLSEYLITLRNRYNYTPVVIQQQNQENNNIEAFKANKIRPTMVGLADSKATGKDASMMLGITNPYSHELSSYLGYNIGKLKGNIRFLEVVLNREGQSNGILPLFFDGTTNTFRELPKATDTEKLERVYDYLDRMRNNVHKTFLSIIKRLKK